MPAMGERMTPCLGIGTQGDRLGYEHRHVELPVPDDVRARDPLRYAADATYEHCGDWGGTMRCMTCSARFDIPADIESREFRIPEHNVLASGWRALFTSRQIAYGVLAYQYEADRHCLECTARRFAANLTDTGELVNARDSEDNAPSAIYYGDWTDGSDEQWLECGTCRDEIAHYEGISCANCGESGHYDYDCYADEPDDYDPDDNHYRLRNCDCDGCAEAGVYDPANDPAVTATFEWVLA